MAFTNKSGPRTDFGFQLTKQTKRKDRDVDEQESDTIKEFSTMRDEVLSIEYAIKPNMLCCQ